MANLVLSYRDDVIAPSDFHLPTDKDNVFLAWKWTNVDHMMYNRNLKLHFEREWANGFRLKAQVQHDRNEPTSALFYQPVGATAALGLGRPATFDELQAAGLNAAAVNMPFLNTSDVSFLLEYQPGATSSTPSSAACAPTTTRHLYAQPHDGCQRAVERLHV